MTTNGYKETQYIHLSVFDSKTHNLIETNIYDISDPYLSSIYQERMYLSDDIFPYCIGLGVPQYYESDILSGKFLAKLEPYEIGKEYTVMCKPYEHTDVSIRFPSNNTIYKSFEHTIDTKEFVD
jgi:hypothetical protein